VYRRPKLLWGTDPGLLVCQALYRSVEKACRDPDNLDWLASSVVESLTPEQEDMNTNLGGTELGKTILVGSPI
jgi:hypothetical protein